MPENPERKLFPRSLLLHLVTGAAEVLSASPAMKANSARPITITNKGPLDRMFCNVAILVNMNYLFIIIFLFGLCSF